MCETEVAHDPPRNTNWLAINLPLYSRSSGAAVYPDRGNSGFGSLPDVPKHLD